MFIKHLSWRRLRRFLKNNWLNIGLFIFCVVVVIFLGWQRVISNIYNALNSHHTEATEAQSVSGWSSTMDTLSNSNATASSIQNLSGYDVVKDPCAVQDPGAFATDGATLAIVVRLCRLNDTVNDIDNRLVDVENKVNNPDGKIEVNKLQSDLANMADQQKQQETRIENLDNRIDVWKSNYFTAIIAFLSAIVV